MPEAGKLSTGVRSRGCRGRLGCKGKGRGYWDCQDGNAVEQGGCREGLIDCLKLMLGPHTQPVSKVLVHFTLYLSTKRSP